MTTKRLPQFDVLKGIAIFMVVMGHVLTMCIRDIDQAFTFKLIGQTHMPLFFFIAGYFTYRRGNVADGDARTFVTPGLLQRFNQLMVPMIVVGGLWLWYFPHSGLQSPLATTLDGALADEWKNGYWFPLVLFEIALVYATIAPILRTVGNFVSEVGVALLICAVVAVFGFLPVDVAAYGSLGLTATFLPVFLAGVLARRYSDGFNRLISNQWATTTAILVGACAVYARMYSWEFPFLACPYMTMAVTIIWHLSLVIVAFAVVTPWVNRSTDDRPACAEGSRSIQLWSLLGRESLGIYLLHYFLLFPMPFLQQPLREMGLGFVPTFTVAAIVAAIVTAITLGIICIIRSSRPLSRLLIGSK